VKLVVERGRWSNPHTLCYQSRSGPGVWLQPFLPEALGDLAGRGVERVLVVPISFVSDHVETLHEINVQARELAERLGIRQFETMPGLNDSPKFISALADVVLRSVGASVPA
jgi:ferrochelatase